MSLINDLLKDLENNDDKNKKPQAAAPAVVPVASAPEADKKPKEAANSLDLSAIAKPFGDKIKKMKSEDFKAALDADKPKVADNTVMKSIKIDWDLSSVKVNDATAEAPVVSQEAPKEAIKTTNNAELSAKVWSSKPAEPVAKIEEKAWVKADERVEEKDKIADPKVNSDDKENKDEKTTSNSIFSDVPYTLKDINKKLSAFKLNDLKFDHFDVYKHTPVVMVSAVILVCFGYWLATPSAEKNGVNNSNDNEKNAPIAVVKPEETKDAQIAQEKAAKLDKDLKGADSVASKTGKQEKSDLSTVKTEDNKTILPAEINASLVAPTNGSEKLTRAVKLMQLGDDKEASRLLLEELVDNPLCIEARKDLSLIYLAQNQSESAIRVVQQGLEYYPTDEKLLRVLAKIQVKSENYAQALQTLQQIPAPHVSEDPEFFALIADLHRQIGEYQLAVDNYVAVLARFPDVGKWWIGLALCLEELKQYHDATDAYNKALRSEGLSIKLKMFAEKRVRLLDPNNQEQYK